MGPGPPTCSEDRYEECCCHGRDHHYRDWLEAEFNADTSEWECTDRVWHTQDLSPIIIDVTEYGKPDTLSGFWRKGDGPKILDYFQTRLFNLRGNRVERWSWVGPRAGLLVHSTTGLPTIVTGLNLFGNNTWGESWNDGYEPLSTLDSDKSGAIEGSELDVLYIWLDANTDAKVDEGEVKSVKDYLSSISVNPTRDGTGNAWAEKGAKLNNGNEVASWDWWTKSYSIPKILVGEGGVTIPSVVIYTSDKEEQSCIYKWYHGKEGEADVITGYLRFIELDGKLYVISVPEKTDRYINGIFAEVTFSEDGTKAFWNFGSLRTEVNIGADGILRGRSSETHEPYCPHSQMAPDKEAADYGWYAKLVDSDKDATVILRSFANANTEQLPKGLIDGMAYFEPSNKPFKSAGRLTDFTKK